VPAPAPDRHERRVARDHQRPRAPALGRQAALGREAARGQVPALQRAARPQDEQLWPHGVRRDVDSVAARRLEEHLPARRRRRGGGGAAGRARRERDRREAGLGAFEGGRGDGDELARGRRDDKVWAEEPAAAAARRREVAVSGTFNAMAT
jgi:hypothetical protein